jgi:hypothetical protein
LAHAPHVIHNRRVNHATLDEAEIERLAHQRELAAGYREAARRALAFARRYRREEGAGGGERERACVAQAQVWRSVVRDLHAGRPVPALPAGVGPGVARARAAPVVPETKTG